MKLALLVPDGAGVRNFLLSHLLKQDFKRLTILHVIPDELLAEYSRDIQSQVRWHHFLESAETPYYSFARYCASYAQTYFGNTAAMRLRSGRRLTGTWRHKAIQRAASIVGRAFANPKGVDWLQNWSYRIIRKAPAFSQYVEVLGRDRPDVMICSHQRPPRITLPVLAAKELGIPTATFIFSWDNLTSKGSIVAPFDHYFVWSEHMREELLRYYPLIPEQNVHVVGTPQFEAYSDPSLLWSREEFFTRINADPSRPLICYSGGDVGTCPEDQEHVRILMELIREGKIERNPQVLTRPTPVEDGRRYESVRRDYPEMIFAAPEWKHTKPGDWSRSLPTAADLQFLANLTHHADLNVNLASTMTLDFAIHDKPVVNVAFDVASPPVHGVPLWDYYYKFDHYKPVVEIGAARFARSREELAEHINAYLAKPELDHEARRRFVDLEIGKRVGQSNVLLADALQRIQSRQSLTD